jgi:glycosyltransferase involved in cell wall biosynthesis
MNKSVRIAVVNWSRRKVGGVETYLSGVIPELCRRGFPLAFWSEDDIPTNREPIELPDGVQAWCASELGRDKALAALHDWRPDLLYVHKVSQPATEGELLKIAPAVFFAHDYYGTCISGAKTFKYPRVVPCSRRFGWKCLLHYYPHRCGGWSPVTMVKLYLLQSKRLKLLRKYRAIVTHSDHLQSEYIKHGLEPSRVHNLSYYAHTMRENYSQNKEIPRADVVSLNSIPDGDSGKTKPYYKIIFVGRMDQLKGGRIFLQALPQVKSLLARPLKVTFAGDGPDRTAWERQAERVQALSEGLSIEFVGWANAIQLNSLWTTCDLLVVPSQWPEPFGLVGVEAGLHGVPVAAFSVGGIPTWLINGVNGYLAPGDPPTPAGLTDAIVKCLQDPVTHASLRQNALKLAQEFNIGNHMVALLDVFEKVVGDRGKSPALSFRNENQSFVNKFAD